jgi:hypothetical protein
MTHDEYSKLAGLTATAIKSGATSMLHMRHALTVGREDNDALRWGRLVHVAVLQPALLDALPRWDGGTRRGKAWDAFEEAVGGDDYLMPDDSAKLSGITTATRKAMTHLPAVKFTEHSLAWTDEAYGLATARIDAILEGGGILDLKTCAKIRTRSFLAQAEDLGYRLQMGWYAHGAALAGFTGPAWILAVESKPPHATALYNLKPQLLKEGYEEAAEIARAYRASELLGSFAGPYDDVVLEFERPEWTAPHEVDMTDTEGDEA